MTSATKISANDCNNITAQERQREHEISDNTTTDSENNSSVSSTSNSTPPRKRSSFPSSFHYDTSITIPPPDYDCQDYLDRYPSLRDNSNLQKNILFYQNRTPSKPEPSRTVEEILTTWWGKYELLEYHHGYIQWLFPLQVSGLNSHAQPLQKHEAKLISSNRTTRARVLRAYKLMLDFYGLRLVDEESGEIERAPHWKGRFRNLATNSHNWLRITRILRSLGELGWEKLKYPLVKFLLWEVFHGELPPLKRSCLSYWIYSLRHTAQREEMVATARKCVKQTCSCHPEDHRTEGTK